MTTFYTDYPIVELGDTPNKKAPIREVLPVSWDGDKYVTVLVGVSGIHCQIKSGYIYTQPGRIGEVGVFDTKQYFKNN